MYYILVMGDKGCGKTQFIQTLTNIHDYTPACSVIHKRHVDGGIHKFCLQESSDCKLIPKVDAVLYLYDLHRDDCYKKAKQFADKYKGVCPVILVGTKHDKCKEKEFCPSCYKHIYVDNFKESSVLRVIEFLVEVLHLRSFKTPPSGAVMSDEDDADCAFSMCEGVKEDKERLDASELVALRKHVKALKIASAITLVGLSASTSYICYNNFRK